MRTLGASVRVRRGCARLRLRAVPRTLETNKALIVWSDDLTTVTKTPITFWDEPLLGSGRNLFQNERRVNRLLVNDQPPVRIAPLRSSRRWSLTFDAIDGEPLGPKFPTALPAHDVTRMIELVERLAAYQPRRRWFRQFSIERRVDLHEQAGLLTEGDAEMLRALVARRPPRLRFAHGDVTARNILRTGTDDVVLIDWEWAGLYPEGYELAFLWYSLVDVPGARDTVEAAVPERLRTPFTVSALLVQLLHLHIWLNRQQQPRPLQLQTREELLAQVRDLANAP